MVKSSLNRLHTAVFMLIFNVSAIIALFYFSWEGLAVGFTVWLIANWPGVGVGFHRLLTHRGFVTPKWLEYTLTTLGCLALQGSPTRWVAVHRIHHKFVEQEGKDPHTPRDGMAWSQWLWMLKPNPAIEGDINIKYAPDLAKDKYHQIIHKLWWLPSLILGSFLLYIGWPNPSLLLWGAVVPVAIGWQITWMVNSVNHKWGSKRFEINDDSTNNWIVAILTFGEGWHNNHHAYPNSARHGLAWYEVDMNYYLIRILEFFKLAKKLKLASIKN